MYARTLNVIVIWFCTWLNSCWFSSLFPALSWAPTYPHLIHPSSINPKQLYTRANALLTPHEDIPPPHSLLKNVKPSFQSSKQNPISSCVTSTPPTTIPPILCVSSWSGHPHKRMKTSNCSLDPLTSKYLTDCPSCYLPSNHSHCLSSSA